MTNIDFIFIATTIYSLQLFIFSLGECKSLHEFFKTFSVHLSIICLYTVLISQIFKTILTYVNNITEKVCVNMMRRTVNNRSQNGIINQLVNLTNSLANNPEISGIVNSFLENIGTGTIPVTVAHVVQNPDGNAGIATNDSSHID